MGWTGWKFVAAISLGMRAIFVLITSAIGLSKKQNYNFDKKKLKKQRHRIWVTNHLLYTPSD